MPRSLFPDFASLSRGLFSLSRITKLSGHHVTPRTASFFTSHHVPALKGVPGFTHQRYSVNSVILLSEKAPGHTPAIIQAESRSRGFDTVGLRNQKTSEGVVQRHVSRY